MMLATGRINDEQVIDDEASGIIFIAWRVLYAEIIHSRIEETRPSWKRAAKRGIGLLINRMTAWRASIGESGIKRYGTRPRHNPFRGITKSTHLSASIQRALHYSTRAATHIRQYLAHRQSSLYPVKELGMVKHYTRIHP